MLAAHHQLKQLPMLDKMTVLLPGCSILCVVRHISSSVMNIGLGIYESLYKPHPLLHQMHVHLHHSDSLARIHPKMYDQ